MGMTALISLNDRLFLALNSSGHPAALKVAIAKVAALSLTYVAVALVPSLWIWGTQSKRGALLSTTIGVSVALGINQILGLLWVEPRPFMIRLGHTLIPHAADNSFPSDHATFVWGLGFALIATSAYRIWGTVACLLGLSVAWSRIYLGVHFPIDMATSFIVALVGAQIARATLPLINRWLFPMIDSAYERILRTLHLPQGIFPPGSTRQARATRAAGPHAVRR